MARWDEEVSLLKEEMRRVLVFLQWKSNDWFQRGDAVDISSPTTCPYLAEGLLAYACRQAHVFRDIHNHFLGIWKGFELPREQLMEPACSVGLEWDTMELDGDDA